MSTISIPRSHVQSIPAGYIEATCAHCNDAIYVRESGAEAPECDACRRALAEGELGKVKGDITDIVKGRGVFEFCSPGERQRFLRELRQLVLSNTLLEVQSPVTPSSEPWTMIFDAPTLADLDAIADTEPLEPEEAAEPFEQW